MSHGFVHTDLQCRQRRSPTSSRRRPPLLRHHHNPSPASQAGQRNSQKRPRPRPCAPKRAQKSSQRLPHRPASTREWTRGRSCQHSPRRKTPRRRRRRRGPITTRRPRASLAVAHEVVQQRAAPLQAPQARAQVAAMAPEMVELDESAAALSLPQCGGGLPLGARPPSRKRKRKRRPRESRA